MPARCRIYIKLENYVAVVFNPTVGIDRAGTDICCKKASYLPLLIYYYRIFNNSTSTIDMDTAVRLTPPINLAAVSMLSAESLHIIVKLFFFSTAATPIALAATSR